MAANIPLQEALWEREFRRCAPDWETSSVDELVEAFDYFCRTYWTIRHPEKGRIPFELWPEQRETIKVWTGERYSIVLKARQIGFSTLAGAYAFWLTYFYGDRAVIMLSRTERDAAKLLQKSKYGYTALPSWMRNHPNSPIRADNTQSKLSWTNESYIESLPSASDPARGESVFLVIVDEMAFLPNSDEAWSSIEPIADRGGRIIMLSTANGEGNLFHKLWLGAKSPWGNHTNRFTGVFWNWRVGGRDDNWYAAKASDLPEWQLAQEYPNDPEEAFLKSGRPVFHTPSLREMEVLPPEFTGRMVNGVFEPDEDLESYSTAGPLKVFVEPIEGHRYSMGVDTAEGLEHGDFSSIHVIDANTHEVVAHWHGHIDPDQFGAEVVNWLGRWYNNALAVVERNNHGLTTITHLQMAHYFPIYRSRKLQSRTKQQTEQMGWTTTAVTKPLAIDELAKEIRLKAIKVYDEATIAELRAYQREGNGKMHGSPHDDRVMSLALANQGLKYVFLEEYRPKTKPPRGTFAHFLEHATFIGDDEDDSEPRRIGANGVRRSLAAA